MHNWYADLANSRIRQSVAGMIYSAILALVAVVAGTTQVKVGYVCTFLIGFISATQVCQLIRIRRERAILAKELDELNGKTD